MYLDQHFLLPQISEDLAYLYEDFRWGHDKQHLVNSYHFEQAFLGQVYRILDSD